jgi:hypothetical protein
LAEAVRQGINLLKKGEHQEVYRRLAEGTRGLWKKGNGLAYQEELRREWE